MTDSSSNWWMYHKDPAHTGFIGESESSICSSNVASLTAIHTLALPGSILSVPAIADGYVYVGLSNSQAAKGSNGGTFYKINIESGAIEREYTWEIDQSEGDVHGFTGMGCTPAIAHGKVYFSAFNGKLYCLDAETLEEQWVTDLRHADLDKNQPVTNTTIYQSGTQAEGWSSPLAVKGKIYVGMGEGENPYLASFVYCLDGETGKVIWIYCTCKFEYDRDNPPNVLPDQAIAKPTDAISGYEIRYGQLLTLGCSVWSSIAYDEDLKRIYCATGNPVPDGPLPTHGYSNGLLSLDAESGDFKGFVQIPAKSSYRVSDSDVDVGASPTIFTRQGRKVVGIGCKNGCYLLADADTLEVIKWRQMLPFYTDGSQIPTIDPHLTPDQLNDSTLINPPISNEQSNQILGENYFGTYSTASIHPGLQRLFVGMGGPNYHNQAPGIDYTSTPFMRVMDWNTLEDAWPMDDRNDPPRYCKSSPPMY
ncbi:MAG: PQQ-binding-like beta-propeller repeat protein [Spirulina sp.]